jgi:hypothetical protein
MLCHRNRACPLTGPALAFALVVDEGRHAVLKVFRFEIFRQTYRRYAWRFVVIEEGRTRVLARSHRGYRSVKRVKRAIGRLQAAAGALQGANVVNVCEADAFPLPDTSFQVFFDVVPLVVEQSPVIEDRVSSVQPAVQAVRPSVQPAQPAVQQDVVEPVPPRPGPAVGPKPPVRGGPRGKKAT